MGNAVRLRGEAQKKIINLMNSLHVRFSRWEIWQDFIIMSAISIANATSGAHKESREREYMNRASRYSTKEMDCLAQMLAEVVMEMERNPDQDFLGDLFMSLDLGDEWKGQFFTPYSVCRAMAGMTYGDDIREQIEEKGWVSVNDPACGAGALLLAFANECRSHEKEINYQTSILFVAQDIDYLAGMMCYIQLSLMGCPGYVVIDDTLSRPATSIDARGLIPYDGSNVWYTPMYFRTEWHWRRIWAMADIMLCAEDSQTQNGNPTKEQPSPIEQSLLEGKSGQLALF